mmetsp:Transcript_9459/g.19586  ORF Transcript_9459/g.19586 Transcript_9459/m.19586 type:complete len:158 (-) Transcript_9459:429-902(-)|eukprot:CAMPEP_0118930814 /NCGR_PEP_ID=MMETSP1169-20130426/7377_1 /TAXON_ID=36882 /ORGANISM="Pyramimonas obovata, Strain CCMP722" /LENGTH=157 /DNA_ID=CAMNT_0006873229 /DNA_START=57 /DNA_END=530 /DNA_ORIENTATION=-
MMSFTVSRAAQPTNVVNWKRDSVSLQQKAVRASPKTTGRGLSLKVTAAKKDFSGDYTAENQYKCMDQVSITNLKAEWAKRESAMKALQGFKAFSLQEVSPSEFVASQTWASKDAYETWMDSDFKRKSHFFGNIYQYTTKDKYSVPEEFMPIYISADQ